jgi:hypothetical protein
MAQPWTLQFGPWAPDLQNVAVQMPFQYGATPVPSADCLNVYYVNGVYKSVPTAAPVAGSPALPFFPAVSGFTFQNAAGFPTPVIGTSSGQVLIYQNGAWLAAASSSSANSLWNFAQFGPNLYAQPVALSIAVGGVQQIIQVTGGGGSIVGSPNGAVMATVGQFLMVGDICGAQQFTNIAVGDGASLTFFGTLPAPVYPTSITVSAGAVTGTDDGNGNITGTGVTGTIAYDSGQIGLNFSVAPGIGVAINANSSIAYRARLQWSAIDNPQSWPTPLTNAALAAQSGQQDQEYAYGPIMFIAGYPLYGVIFQRNAIARASYIGGNVVFSWQTFSRNLGLLTKGAAVQVAANTYFLSDQGFFYTDGASVYPIGTASDNSSGIDQWFFSNVNQAALSAITAGYDARSRCVFFAIPTGTNTQPDTLLIYNVIAGRWTRAAAPTQVIWTDSDGFTDRLGVINQTPAYCLLTGAPASGYLESCDVMFTDGFVRYPTACRANVNCSDTPNVVIGSRNTLKAPVAYANASTPDSFGAGFSPVLTQGLYNRVRVTSANAQALHGATLMLEKGGFV